jgi:BCCT family betaine/carnitine transporter
MGLFFGRISRGRTIRQVVLGIIGWGSLGCFSFMAICGGYALHLEINDIIPVSEILQAEGNAAAVVAIVNTLPGAKLAIFVFTVLSFIFLATTLDSVAYVLASITTRDLPGDVEPGRINRLVWAFALAFIAVGLLAVGGLETVQSSSVITALPLIPVLLVLVLSLLKWLHEDFGSAVTAPAIALEVDHRGKSRPVETTRDG